MIDNVSNLNRHSINVTLNDPRAFELQFIRKDGKDSARCIVLGQAEAARVSLSPGSYMLRLRHLSDAPTQPITKAIKITSMTDTLDLSAMFPNVFDGIVYQPITAPRIGEMKQAIRQSRVRRKRSSEPNLQRNFTSLQAGQENPSIKFENLEQASTREPIIGINPRSESLRFEVGLSHNPASRNIGWLTADRLEIKSDVSSEGTLKLSIQDNALYSNDSSESHRRVRLTLAIEGRPAIRTPLPLFVGGVNVSIAPLWIDDEPDALIRIEAIDPQKQALVAALSDLGQDDVRSIVNWTAGSDGDGAVEMLLHKKKDLWAATVAALLLAKTYQLKDVAQWAYNLENFAPHISDAAVTAAWARASDESIDLDKAERKTLNHLKRSRLIGAPTFKVTHSIALELLNAIRGSSTNAKRRDDARHEMSIWIRRAQRRLFKGPYIMWEQAGGHLQQGRLPSQRYLRIAKGALTEGGFHAGK